MKHRILIWLTLGIAVNTALIACDSFDRHSISVNKCKCSEENISNNSWFNRLSDENKKLLISLLDEKKEVSKLEIRRISNSPNLLSCLSTKQGNHLMEFTKNLLKRNVSEGKELSISELSPSFLAAVHLISDCNPKDKN